MALWVGGRAVRARRTTGARDRFDRRPLRTPLRSGRADLTVRRRPETRGGEDLGDSCHSDRPPSLSLEAAEARRGFEGGQGTRFAKSKLRARGGVGATPPSSRPDPPPSSRPEARRAVAREDPQGLQCPGRTVILRPFLLYGGRVGMVVWAVGWVEERRLAPTRGPTAASVATPPPPTPPPSRRRGAHRLGPSPRLALPSSST